jgi:hypothetical protein
MTPECLALLDAQQKLLDERINRASKTYEQASMYKSPDSSGSPGVHLAVSQLSHNADEVKDEQTGTLKQALTHDAALEQLPDVATAEGVRLLRERERLAKWRVPRERTELERRRQRQDIQKGAEKSKRTAPSGKTKMGKERKEAGVCCGLFNLVKLMRI